MCGVAEPAHLASPNLRKRYSLSRDSPWIGICAQGRILGRGGTRHASPTGQSWDRRTKPRVRVQGLAELPSELARVPVVGSGLSLDLRPWDGDRALAPRHALLQPRVAVSIERGKQQSRCRTET